MTGAAATAEREIPAPQPIERSEPVQVPVGDSIRAALKASKDPAEPPNTSAEPSAEGDTPPAPKSQDKPPAVTSSPGERARGPDGKFLAADADVQAAEVAKPTAEKPAATPKLEDMFSVADRAIVSKAPPEIQDWITKREQHYARQNAQSGRELQTWRKAYGQVEDVMAPRRTSIHASGQTEAGLLQQMFAIGDIMSQAPDRFIREFAQAKGIDLGRLVQSNKPSAIDPALQPIVGKMQELEQQQTAWFQSQQQQRDQAIVNDVQSWSSQVDAGGNLLRPHYATFERNGEMEPIVRSIRAQYPQAANAAVLQVAYERALWGNPETRKEMQGKVDADARAKVIEDQKAAAAAALKRSGSITGSQSPGAVPVQPTSLRGQLQANLDAMKNGGARI